MAQIIENKSITFKEPMVVLPLREWDAIEDMLDEYECLVRYEKALAESKNDRPISFEAVKKKYNLK